MLQGRYWIDKLSGSDKLRTSDIAFHHLGVLSAVIFVIGMVAACFSSVDSALTAMTTSFCLDFLCMNETHVSDIDLKKRQRVHLCFVGLMILTICVIININSSIINIVLQTAGYTPIWWRRGESNSCPTQANYNFLQAYFCFDCRQHPTAKQVNTSQDF